MLPERFKERFLNPQNVGKTPEENGTARNASAVCGANLRLSLAIDEKTKTVKQAKFHALGCEFLVAFADLLCEKIGAENSKIGDLDELFNQVKTEIGNFPASRKHCLNLLFETLRKSCSDFFARQNESWNGEEALICSCFGVSESEIESAINEHFCKTVAEVTEICNAGGGCGSCRALIEEVIENNRQFAIFSENAENTGKNLT